MFQQQNAIVLGETIPICTELTSQGIRKVLDLFEKLSARLPIAMPNRPTLSHCFTPVQLDRLVWAATARARRRHGKKSRRAGSSSSGSSSSDDSSISSEEESGDTSTILQQDAQAEVKVEREEDAGRGSSSFSEKSAGRGRFDTTATRRRIALEFQDDACLRAYLTKSYGPKSRDDSVTCLRAVRMPTAGLFTDDNLAAAYVAEFERALDWCAQQPVKSKMKKKLFLDGINPKDLREFLINEEFKCYEDIVMKLLDEYEKLCLASVRLGLQKLHLAAGQQKQHHSAAKPSTVSEERHSTNYRRNSTKNTTIDNNSGGKTSDSNFVGKCFLCDKPGHLKRDCPLLSSGGPQQQPPSKEPASFLKPALKGAAHAHPQKVSFADDGAKGLAKKKTLVKMMRSLAPSQTDIPVVAIQVGLAPASVALSLRSELDSGAQTNLIPRMWIKYLTDLGCDVRPCHKEVGWLREDSVLVLTEVIQLHVSFVGYARRPEGALLYFYVYDSSRPELILGIQDMRKLDLFKYGDDLARVQHSLGLLAAEDLGRREPLIPKLEGGFLDLDEAFGEEVVAPPPPLEPPLLHPCSMIQCPCRNFVPDGIDVEKCRLCHHGWTVHETVAAASHKKDSESVLGAPISTPLSRSMNKLRVSPRPVYRFNNRNVAVVDYDVEDSDSDDYDIPGEVVKDNAHGFSTVGDAEDYADMPPLIDDVDSDSETDYADMPPLIDDVDSDSEDEGPSQRPFRRSALGDRGSIPAPSLVPPSAQAPLRPLDQLPPGLTFGTSTITGTLQDISIMYRHVFSEVLPPEGAQVPPMDIPLLEDNFTPEPDMSYRRYPPKINEALKVELEALLRAGIIEVVDQTVDIAYAAPVVMVPKASGGWRLCVDFRRLNAGIKLRTFPLSRISEILQGCAGAKYFARLDLTKGFWQFLVAVPDRYKTAFRVDNKRYVFRRVPMRITCAPFYLQKTMSLVLDGLLGKGIFLYLDDIVICGRSEEDFISNYEAVLHRLADYGLRCNPSKCVVGVSETHILGHVVNGSGVAMGPERIEEVLNIPMPRTTRELRRFLGSANFMSRFIPNFSILASPLTALTGGSNTPLKSKDSISAFEGLKNAISKQISLAHLDYSLPLVVSTDASNLGVGATLANIYPDGSRRIIACVSHKFTKAESRWKTIEQEAFAVVFALQRWRDILYGHHFQLETDHRNLTYIHAGSSPKVTRWLLLLQEFMYAIKHVPGEDNVWPDLFSRYPLTTPRSNLRPNPMRPESPSELPLSDTSEDEHDVVAITLADFETESLSDLEGKVRGPPASPRSRVGMARDRPPTPPRSRLPRRAKAEASGKEAALPGTRVVAGAVHMGSSAPVGSPLHSTEDDHIGWIKRVHNSTQGHIGINRTLAALQQRGLTWPHMAKDVTTFVNECAICQKQRPSHHQIEAIRGNLKAYALFEELAIDFIGPLPQDELGNVYIFNAICACSSFAELIPTEAASAVIAAHCLLQIVARYGCFRRIRSDRGTHFVNEVIVAFLDLFEIQNVLTLAERPQANGMVERQGGEVMRHLRALVFDSRIRNIWSVVLPLVQRILNRTFRQSLGCTPNSLVYVQAPDLDRGLFEPFRAHEQLTPVTPRYLQQLRDAQEILLDITSLHLLAYQRKVQSRLKPALPTEFAVGSYVLYAYATRPPSKLHLRYAGPFQVVDRDRNNITISDLTSGKLKVVDVDRLRPFYLTGDPRDAARIAASDLGETEVVEIIRVVEGDPKDRSSLRFEVRWSDDDTTIEPWDVVKLLEALDGFILSHPEAKLKHLLTKRPKKGRSGSSLATK